MKQEDDLVAHSWRLVRDTQPHLAITIDLAALSRPYEDPKRLRFHQGVVLDMAARSGSEAVLMRSGDMALVMPPDALQDWQALVDDMIDVFAKDADVPEERSVAASRSTPCPGRPGSSGAGSHATPPAARSPKSPERMPMMVCRAP